MKSPLSDAEIRGTFLVALADHGAAAVDELMALSNDGDSATREAQSRDWCKRWNLEADWMVAAASDAICDGNFGLVAVVTGVRLEFTAVYRATVESQATARARIGRELDAWLRRVAAASEPPSAKYERDHFEWVVQRRVGGSSIDAIARKACRSAKTVSRAINATCRVIGLPPEPRGRPRKPALRA